MRRICIGLAVAALAAANGAAGAPSSKPAADPDEVVCEKITVVGSRLAAKRICATRAEWADKRKQDRELIEKVQLMPNGPCQTVNTHSGAAAC